MSSYPLPTLAAQISPSGISAPQLSDIIESETATYEGIYGSDVELTPDTQDGQLIAIRSTAINDCNQLAIAVYNSFLPGYAQGAGLSAIVGINGLQREAGTNSTVELTIGGTAGTQIANGIVKDPLGNLWNLPAAVEISDSGTVTVTATAQQSGPISIGANAEWTIYTIVLGWQAVTNAAASVPGTAIETDAALRKRQAQSTALPSQTPLDAILAAVANSGGIVRYQIYENDTNETDGNGVPSHSVAVVVEGGNATTIATVISQKKSPGTGTFGNTSIVIIDSKGVPNTIRFFEVAEVGIYLAITIHPLNGWVSSTEQVIVNAIVAFLNALPIGQEVYLNWILGIAGLIGNPLSQTFAITSLTMGISPGSLSSANIPIAFNAAAQCVANNIQITVS